MPDAVATATVQTTERLLAEARVERSKLLGVGVAINGIVNAGASISRIAPHLGWRDVPIAAPLAQHFGIPV